jgi:hypothetical protein
MKHLVLFMALAFLAVGCKAQQLPDHVHAKNIAGTVPAAEYVLIGDTAQKRPLLVYCTGSLAVPLFESENEQVYCSLPFNYKNYVEQFHVLVISKVGIPVLAKTEELDRNHVFIDPETKLPPKSYLTTNAVGHYVALHKQVLQSVRNRPWVDDEHMMVLGHSGGARLAAKVAGEVPGFTHLGYLSAEPQGRMLEMLLQEPRRSQDRSATLMEWLDFWKEVNANAEKTKEPQGDSYATWFTNSENVVDDLLELEIPVFAAMGTADRKAEGMVVIPYEFIRHGKENLTFLPYEGLEHSFFTVTPEGRIDYEKYHFGEVFQDAVDWWLQDKKEFDTHLDD